MKLWISVGFNVGLVVALFWQGHIIDRLSEEGERLRLMNQRYRDALRAIEERHS